MSKNHLRQLIKQIVEAAFNTEYASSKSLALLVENYPNSLRIVLYDPSSILDFISDESEWLTAFNQYGDIALNAIKATLDIDRHRGKCWDAGEVVASAAEKGYGPMMYEIGMSFCPGGLFADRLSVSDSAKNVWKKFDQRSDVQKLHFDDIQFPRTPPKEDDCKIVDDPILNKAYKTRNQSDKTSLLANHKSFMSELSKSKINIRHVEHMIFRMAQVYFTIKYGNE